MRSLFRSFYEGVQAAARAFGQWAFTHRRPIGLLVLTGAVFLAPTTVEAWSIAGAAQEALKLILGLLGWIVQMLGELFVFLVDIFLGFARYNKFGDAQPVKIGWVIVRDICNMFFIVVLLISAFNTIIGWDSSLRYNQVLPKLLLMAILINFSRTLIQVLIDFSQVVMLTFVNAFQAAGAGNFAAAFRINDLLSMRDNFTATGETAVEAAGRNTPGNYDLAAQLFTSFLLALVLIVIANGVMLIMIIYILARIIGLWMALIFSPIAFFVKALPASLQSGLSSFSGKYWSRLAGMLTGGPVVMFFIYLTFAILQTAPANPPANPAGQTAGGTASAPSVLGAQGGGLAGQLELHSSPTAAAGTSFITKVGTSDNVASFIIAVALMLMAIEAAVEASNSVSESVGKVAGQIGSASKGLAFGAAALVASSPWLATKLGYRTVDKRYDLTGKASAAALWTTNKIPIAGQFARPLLMKGMMMRKNEREAEAKELTNAQAGMTTNQRRLVQAGLKSVPGALIGGLADKATNAVSGKLQSLSERGQKSGGVLGKGLGMVAGAASRGVVAANKGLGQAWFTQADQLALMQSAQYLSSDAARAEDQRNLEDEMEDRVARDVRYSDENGYDDKMRNDVADDLVAEAMEKRQSRQMMTVDAIAKRGPIRDHAAIDAIKAQAKGNPLLWGSEKKRNAKAKELFESPAGIAKLDPAAKASVDLMLRGLRGRGVAKVDENGNVSITDDKALRDRVVKEIAAVDKEYAASVQFVMDNLLASTTTNANGETESVQNYEEMKATRLHTDTDGIKRIVNSPKGGRSLAGQGADWIENKTGIALPLGKDVALEVGGMNRFAAKTAQPDKETRLWRNAQEGNALKKLRELATQPNGMDSPEAVEAFRTFLGAEGQITDLTKSKIDYSKPMQKFVADRTAEIEAMLGLNDKGEVQVVGNNDDERAENSMKLQAKMKELRPLAQQVGGRVGQETIGGVVQAMNVKMTLTGTVNGQPHTEEMPITEMWANASAYANLREPDTKEAGFTLLSAAVNLNSSENLEPAVKKAVKEVLDSTTKNYGTSDRTKRNKVSGPARRAFDAGTG